MDEQPNTLKLMTIADAASTLKYSKRTVHRMIQRRELPAFKVGGQWRILESRFQQWLEERHE